MSIERSFGENMRKLKVLWVNEKADYTGGCERYVLDSVSLLKELSVESYLFHSFKGSINPDYVKEFKAAFTLVNVQRQVEEIKPDIIYIHKLDNQLWIEDFLKTGVPVIRFFHDHKLFCLREHKYYTISKDTCQQRTGLNCYKCLGFVNKSGKFPGIKITPLWQLHKIQNLNKRLDAVVVGSAYMGDQVALHGFAKEKIFVNPLYSMESADDEQTVRKKNTILFVGQLLRGKGVDTLLLAMSNVKSDLSLTICGSGHQKEVFESMVEDLSLTDKVKFAGQMSRSELAQKYKQASCLIVPGRTPETFGLIGIEAMRHGTPVIATDVGGVTEWLDDGVTGMLAKSNDHLDLARVMDELFSNPERMREIEKNAREAFKKKFSPDRHIKDLRVLFDSLVKGR